MENIPWVEKYRPTNFENIVIDDLNKKIFKNILNTGYFPNLILYGPPGTGKTTTVINLIQNYQDIYSKRNKDLIIHLNASDERGIETIRNQIYDFVTSKCLFNNGMKFVILDEIDNMTKNAQFAFRYVLLNNYSNVRFCLICNYISKIEKNLQNNFLKLKFNQLPKENIISFIKDIVIKENLNLDKNIIASIQSFYGSDIRSMINFIQNNSEKINILLKKNNHVSLSPYTPYPIKILSDSDNIISKTNIDNISLPYEYNEDSQLLEKMNDKKSQLELSIGTTKSKSIIHFKKFKTVQIINNHEWNMYLNKITTYKYPLKYLSTFIKYAYYLCSQYNIDVKTFVKLFSKYIILNKNITNHMLTDFEYIIHSDDINIDIYLKFFIIKIIEHSNNF